jgi:hypothetical protein
MLDLAVLVAKCMPAMTVTPPATSASSQEHAILLQPQADNTRS